MNNITFFIFLLLLTVITQSQNTHYKKYNYLSTQNYDYFLTYSAKQLGKTTVKKNHTNDKEYSIDANVGNILYSKQRISLQGHPFNYIGGFFLSACFGIKFDHIHQLLFGYGHLGIRYNPFINNTFLFQSNDSTQTKMPKMNTKKNNLLYNEDLTFAYLNDSQILQYTSIIAGFHLLFSNQKNSTFVYSIFTGHITRNKTIAAGCFYYVTNSSNFTLFQASPEIAVTLDRWSIFGKSAFILPIVNDHAKTNIPQELQLSAESGLGYTGNHTYSMISAVAGQRSYVVESQGFLIQSVTDSYLWGLRALFRIKPIDQRPFFLHYMITLDFYEDYRSVVNTLGCTYQWH